VLCGSNRAHTEEPPYYGVLPVLPVLPSHRMRMRWSEAEALSSIRIRGSVCAPGWPFAHADVYVPDDTQLTALTTLFRPMLWPKEVSLPTWTLFNILYTLSAQQIHHPKPAACLPRPTRLHNGSSHRHRSYCAGSLTQSNRLRPGPSKLLHYCVPTLASSMVVHYSLWMCVPCDRYIHDP
jgi:hypothetical protein